MLGLLFHSLKTRDYRIYYFVQLISITGTWMQNVAQAWLVYRLSHSSVQLGLVAFAGLAPVLLLGLLGGVLADRYPRKTLLITAQTLAMAQALTLAALTLSGWVQTWHIIALALVLGIVHALEMPTRHSFIAQLVPREDLPNAIALNSSIFNTARFIGPAVAGWLVALIGEGPVFVINAITFVMVLLGLMMIQAHPAPHDSQTPRPRLSDALDYARHQPRIRAALLLLALVSLVATAYSVLMPILSHEVYHGGAETLGNLLGAAGLGALTAALRLAYLSGRQRLDVHIGNAAIAAGVGMLAFSMSHWLWMALPVLLLIGFSLTTFIASVNTLIQMLVPDTLRGRVMALFSVLFIGLTSLSNLSAGFVADRIGAPHTVMLFGAITLLVGGIYRWHAPRLERTAQAA